MRPSAYSPTSDYSDSNPPSSRHLTTDNLSVILNIDKTVAKSRQIIQESLEVSRKNNERRQLLEERLKSIVAQNESSRTDVSVTRGFEEEQRPGFESAVDDSRDRSRVTDLKYHYEEEQAAREKAESQVSDLRAKLLRFERLEHEYNKVKEELYEAREELRREQNKNRELTEFGSLKGRKLQENVEDLESALRKLKAELERKQEENTELERSIKTANEQRAELLRECELLRQTLADLKKLHHRELEEMEKRLDEAIREKNIAERSLNEAQMERKVTIRREKDGLEAQVMQLEAKLKDLEGKYTQQTAVNKDLQSQVQSLCYENKPEDKLITAFEVQMQENARRLQELQLRLEDSRARKYVSDSDSELSNEELTAMVRKEQEELGLSGVLRPRNAGKKTGKAKEMQRVYASAPRRKPAKATEKRTASRCRCCQN